MVPFKQNGNGIYEKALSWFWVVLFISAVLYLRWLLVAMDKETAQLSEERERFRADLETIQKENEKFYEEFQASVDEALESVR